MSSRFSVRNASENLSFMLSSDSSSLRRSCVLKIPVRGPSSFQPARLKLQQLYLWKHLNSDPNRRERPSALRVEMENQHRGTSYISANTTDKPERMRMSCAFWFCGEEEKKSMLHGSISSSRGGGGGGGGILLRMWIYSERTIHKVSPGISWMR